MTTVTATGPPQPIMTDNERLLTQNQLYDTLANERRRACVRYLLDGSTDVSVKELATYVARQVSDESPPSDSFQQSTYISLVQTHLPKLDDYGVIDYDADAKRVGVGPALEEVSRYLGGGPSTEATTDRTVALGVSVATAAMLAVGLVDSSLLWVTVWGAIAFQAALSLFVLYRLRIGA